MKGGLLVVLAVAASLSGCQSVRNFSQERYSRNNESARAWLSDQIFPAEINISGSWRSRDWGDSFFSQTDRTVKGNLEIIRWRAWSAVPRLTCWRVREGDGSITASSWKCRRRTSSSAIILARSRIDQVIDKTFVLIGPVRLRPVQAKVSAPRVR